MSGELTEAEKTIERFKVKRLIQMLESARGIGTSVISVYMTPKEQISAMVMKLNNEYGTASNIKSHTNKLSVQSAITAALAKLKTFTRTPANGMILYSGTVMTADNKEKKMTMDISPFKAVSRSLYLCDNRFHTEELHRMLESDDKFGFIIMDGSGTMYATLCGDVKEKLGGFTVDLPKKHGRGGQSKNRFGRIREEKRHHYVKKVAEHAVGYFITNDVPNVRGLVLAGCADFKEKLYQSENFDPRLQAIVVKVVDIAHPGDVGLNQAIDMSSDALSGVKLVQEKKLLQIFFDQIALDTQQYCFGATDTMQCMEAGAVETLICFEDLPLKRYSVVKNKGSEEESTEVHILSDEEAVRKNIHAHEAGKTQNEISEEDYVDWLAQNYQKFGCTLELISDRSSEGTQFVRGFGGIGGILRYKMDVIALRDHDRPANEAGDEKEKNSDEDDFDDDFM